MKKKFGSKFIIAFLSLTLVLGVLPGIAFAKDGTLSGDGSKEKPYIIYNYQDLKAFAKIVNDGSYESCAVLEADIVAKNNTTDVQYARDWKPIGGGQFSYKGIFDGNGHTITGLSTPENYAGDCVGLFGYILDKGIVKNVDLKDGNLTGNKNVGGVAGANQGTVMNCYYTGTVSGSDCKTGGVAGANSGTIMNCHNTGTVSGSIEVGGVVGENAGEIRKCYNTGSVFSGDYSSETGGIAGFNSGIIENCYNTGHVSGNNTTGGITGGYSADNSNCIKNCYNTGVVSGNAMVGGVAGAIEYGTVENCYNIGAVSGSGAVGSVVGYITYSSVTVKHSYFDEEICKGLSAVGENPKEATVSNVLGLKTEKMTGANALSNMKFHYDNPDENPWMVKANTDKVGFYPHLKGFDLEGIRQMSPEEIQPENWPAKIEFDIPDPKKEETKVSGIPLATMTAKGKNSLVIKWTEVKGAAGYDIFFAECNHNDKSSPKKIVKTVNAGKTLSWTKKGLKKGAGYKACVKAFVMKDGKKVYVVTSPAVHAFTGGYTKAYTNAKAVKVNKTKVSLKKGKTFTIKAQVIKLKKNKMLMPKSHAPVLRYLSTDEKVATVSSKGKIQAKGKGTCYVYVYAHNGVSKKIKVTVKVK